MDDVEDIYTGDAQLLRPGRFVAELRKDLRAAWPISRRLLVRDLRTQYRQSVLGYVWALVPALAVTAVWAALKASAVIDAEIPGLPYVVYVFVGMVLWLAFVEAINVPLRQLTDYSGVLTKVRFPPEAVLLAGFGDVAITSLVRVAVVMPVVLAYGVVPSAGVILAPAGVLAIVLLGFALGLILAPFGLLYHDFQRGLQVATMVWFFATPVAYLVPDTGPARYVTALNPVTPLLQVSRDLLTGMPPSQLLGFTVVSVTAAGLVLVGWAFLRLALPHLVDRISA